jgi:hypothetical protein
MTDHRDVIEAFLDNEPVGAADLSAALDDADAREHFVEVLVLRGLVSDAGGPRQMTDGVSRAAEATGFRRRTAIWLAAAAALVVVGTTGGYLAGRLGFGVARQADTPVAAEAPATSAPAPTHVIRLENGVNWNERSGGN